MTDETPQEPAKIEQPVKIKYAEIDTVTGKCIGVSFLSGEVVAEHLIQLADTDAVNLGDTYADGVWTPAPPPPPPGPSQIDIIGQQLVEREMAEMELRSQNELLGNQIVNLDLRLLEGGL